MSAEPTTYGMLAQFETPADIVYAAEEAHKAGYRKMEAYAPFPVEELPEAVGHSATRLPVIVFLGGLMGCLGGYFFQWYTATIAYPYNIGGRPYHSWPSFMPVTFELTVLLSALTAVASMLLLNGLPRPHHPLFGVPGFERATRDRFFLCIESIDPKYDREATWKFLADLKPVEIVEVPN